MSAVKNYFKEQFQWSMFSLEHSKATDFYLSCWQTSRSSVPLLICRALLFLASLGIVLSSFIIYCISGIIGFWFIYLTHWGLVLITLATGFSAAVSARCYIYGPISAGAEFELPWYVKTYWVLYNIATPMAFLITIFYWVLLYNSGVEEELNHVLDVAVHGLNSIIMFLLLISSSQPTRLVHLYQPVLFALFYVFFGIIYYLAGGVDPFGNPWVYPMVDWSKPGSTAVLMVVTALLLIIAHCITVGLAAARDAVTSTLLKPSVTVHIDEGLPLRQRVGGGQHNV